MKQHSGDCRTLILSATARFEEFLTPSLSSHGIVSIVSAKNLRDANRFAAEAPFELVFINAPLLDGDGFRFAIEASDAAGAVVFMALPAERYEEALARLSPHGVYLLQKPLSSKAISTALDWMLATRARLFEIEEKRVSLEEKMKDLAVINRAKWILIDKLRMSEAEAHYHIEKQAMDRRISKREVAEEIIRIHG